MVQHENTAKQASFSHHGLKMDCRFDAAGKLRQRTDSTTEGRYVYSYAYDARGRLTAVHKDNREVERYAYNASGQSVMRSSYLRHCAGSSKCELHYDSRGRLVSDGQRGFSYDKHGALNEIWDGDGQTRFSYVKKTLVEKVRTTKGLQLRYAYEGIHPVRCYRYLTLYAEYQWDAKDRLVLFRDHDVNVDYHFSYTPEGHVDSLTLRRMPQKQGQTFAPDTDWSEQSRDWMHLNAATSRKKRLDDFLQSYSLPLKLNCACDQIGTLRLLTDPRGRVVKSISRDSFGNLIEDSFADMYIPLGFAGGLEDRYTGFTRFGWRDYDPVAGRFMSVDPAKDLRGDADLYDYCADDPVNYVGREGTTFVPFLVPLLAGTTGALGLGLGGSYGAAKLADATQEARTGQPSTAARDGVKEVAPKVAGVSTATAVAGSAALAAPELLQFVRLHPNLAHNILDVALATADPEVPTPTTLAGQLLYVWNNREKIENNLAEVATELVKAVAKEKNSRTHGSKCTPQTQPRDKDGKFMECSH